MCQYLVERKEIVRAGEHPPCGIRLGNNSDSATLCRQLKVIRLETIVFFPVLLKKISNVGCYVRRRWISVYSKRGLAC